MGRRLLFRLHLRTLAAILIGSAGLVASPADAGLPALDERLHESMSAARDDAGHSDPRVIVFLEAAPLPSARTRALASERGELRDVRRAIRETMETFAAEPNLRARSARDRAREERSRLRPLLERHEAASARVRARLARDVRTRLAPEHARMRQALEALGARVEHSIWSANALVVRVPAAKLAEAAALDGVIRVAADDLEQGHLTTADDAVLVNASGGLWAAGETGGVFDPAIVDSGIDRTNPLLADQPGYTNYWAESLSAASSDPNWVDALDEDDRQGHGTFVQGIVASHGSAGHPVHLGLAYGVEEVVQLKAGFCCVAGNTAMYNSDRMAVIDLALHAPHLIESASGVGTFSGDIDGINVSYGGETDFDDTDAARFIDAVIEGHTDLPITISAGNTGPSNTRFHSPANAWNAITVANVDDQGTSSRVDDVVAAASSRGPTAAGRRKPDIGAPGTSISAPTHDWETGDDISPASGTSMAAPVVLGVIMDLMDAGVLDELELKALLLNTARKNDPGIAIESDADGWDPAVGWGYLNAFEAYARRLDVRSGSVTENGTTGDHILFAGSMQDAGSGGEGRDRATLVWNRHASYAGASVPNSFFSLSNLDLHLFEEVTGALVDDDVTVLDNVQQVRIGAGAPMTPVVVRVDAASVDFGHGGASESWALATGAGFTEVILPTSFPATAIWPLEVEPGEVFDVEFWVRNDGPVATHANVIDLWLGGGFTLQGGADPAFVGTVVGSSGQSTHASWTIEAPMAPGPATILVHHFHSSYGDNSGIYPWSLPIQVVADTTPPTPLDMTFEVPPSGFTTTQMSMRAATASDLNGPVEYVFEFLGSPSGGAGGMNSAWQTPTTWVNGGLGENHEYCYRVRARDAAQVPNETNASPIDCDYTVIGAPIGVEISSVTTTSMEANASVTPPNLALDGSGLRITNQTTATDSGWLQVNSGWTSGGLLPNTSHDFVARARNGDGTESGDSPGAMAYTLAAAPTPEAVIALAHDAIEVAWSASGNPAGTEFLAENVDTAETSGWQTAMAWASGGLTPGTAYTFQVKARNGDGVETEWVQLGSPSTAGPLPVPGLWGAGRLLLCVFMVMVVAAVRGAGALRATR